MGDLSEAGGSKERYAPCSVQAVTQHPEVFEHPRSAAEPFTHCLCAATASSVCRILQRQSLGRAHQCAKQCRQNSRTFTDRSAKPVPWKPTHAAPTARLATKVTQMSKELHRIRLGPRRLRIHTNTRTMQTSNHRKRRNWKIRRHPSSISSSRPSNPAQT